MGHKAQNLRGSWLILSAAGLITSLGLTGLPLATHLAAAATVLLVLRASWVSFPCLLLLQITGTGFWRISDVPAGIEPGSFLVGSERLSLSLILAVAVTARIIIGVVLEPKCFQSVLMRSILAIWLGALIVTAYSALLGRQEGNPSYTIPLRSSMWAGAVLYGVIVARTISKGIVQTLLQQLVIVSTIMILAALIGLLQAHVLFLLIAFAPSLFGWSLTDKSILCKVISGIGLLGAIAYSLGLGLNNDGIAGGILGKSGSTFTLNGLIAVGVCLSVLAQNRQLLSISQYYAKLLGAPAFLFGLGVTFAIAAVGPSLRLGIGAAGLTSSGEDFNLTDRFIIKIFDDRSVIWRGALEVIATEPILIKPSGRSYELESPTGGAVEWAFGAHNVYLDQLRMTGLLGGLSVLIICLVVQHRLARILANSRSLPVKTLSVPLLATFIVGFFTGSYPLVDITGFWLFGIAGVIQTGKLEYSQRAIIK
jgi:hypothetical protein